MSKHSEWVDERRKILHELITVAFLESKGDLISFDEFGLKFEDVPEEFKKACFAIYDMALEDGEVLTYKKRQAILGPNGNVLFPGDDGYDETNKALRSLQPTFTTTDATDVYITYSKL